MGWVGGVSERIGFEDKLLASCGSYGLLGILRRGRSQGQEEARGTMRMKNAGRPIMMSDGQRSVLLKTLNQQQQQKGTSNCRTALSVLVQSLRPPNKCTPITHFWHRSHPLYPLDKTGSTSTTEEHHSFLVWLGFASDQSEPLVTPSQQITSVHRNPGRWVAPLSLITNFCRPSHLLCRRSGIAVVQEESFEGRGGGTEEVGMESR